VIAHVILFSPKPELTDVARRDLLDSLVAASTGIPSLRTFRVGRRVTHGLPGYEQLMRDDYEFAAIAEFDDMDGLKAYLAHPSHAALGRHFMASAARSLAYDYTLVDAADVALLTG
jgi:stress responsive alpha/beta barrel protein